MARSADTSGVVARCDAADSDRNDALEALTWNWGDAYDIGCDGGEWWFRRKDGRGGRETAASADDLHKRIVEDYSFLPVPRDLALTSPSCTRLSENPDGGVRSLA